MMSVRASVRMKQHDSQLSEFFGFSNLEFYLTLLTSHTVDEHLHTFMRLWRKGFF